MTLSWRIVAVAVAAASVAGCSPDGATIAREPASIGSSPSVTSQPSVGGSTPERPDVAARLLPAPGDCRGPAPRPRLVAPAYGKLVGEEPLWAGVYAAFRQESQAFSASDAPRKRYGFRIKVLWIMSPKQEEPVTITGTNLRTGASLYFDVEDLAKHDAAATLNPAIGGLGEGGWREFPSYLYFDGAGCFELEAEWEKGSWRMVFGLGQ
jgi:hypothetical protein